MKIALALLLITVASALDHHDVYSWSRRREDFKVTASRSVAPIKVKETRAPRPTPAAQSTRRSRPSGPFADDTLGNPARRHAFAEDAEDQLSLWSPVTVRTRQDLTRENRAIEDSPKNAIGRPSVAKVEQYQYFSNYPYGGDASVEAILQDAERPKDTTFLSKDNANHFLDHNAEEADWSSQNIFEKDSSNDEEEQMVEEEREGEEINMQNFLDEIKRKRLSGDLEELTAGHRQGRRRKLTSQQQGALLVETLRKKRNYTNDHRGHSSNLQSGLMDMLGRSMFADTEMGRKYRSSSE